MKYLLFLIITITSACRPTDRYSVPNDISIDQYQNEYDSLLAKQLGADNYGMRKYVIAFLKRGPNRDQSKEEKERLQNAHMENITTLAEQKKLVLAGPFLDDEDLRGIYIFDVETIEEAKQLTATDPAIQEGSLVMELHPWYGSAAINAVNNIHNRISKIKI